MKFSFSKKLIFFVTVLIAGAVGGSYYFFYVRESIIEYNVERDKKFILSLFDKDWYWLSGYEREESDTDLFLERRSPSDDPRYQGKLQIKVMYAKNRPVGFVAYYMKNSYEGTLLFIDVAHEFRRLHYGRVLIDYAVNEMRRQGAGVVRLVTRPQNIPAQTLYKRSGFREYFHDDTYSFFEKRLQ